MDLNPWSLERKLNHSSNIYVKKGGREGAHVVRHGRNPQHGFAYTNNAIPHRRSLRQHAPSERAEPNVDEEDDITIAM